MDERKFIFQIGQRLKKNCIFVWSAEEYTNYINETDKVYNNIVCLMNANFEIIKMSCVDKDMIDKNGTETGDGEVDNTETSNTDTNIEEGSNI